MEEWRMRKQFIEEICSEKGIEKEEISYGWISILKKGKIQKKLVNYNFQLNPKIAIELAKDKYSTYEVLTYYGIPIVEHQVLFNQKMMPSFETSQPNEILKNDKKQVIKANNSLQGKDVYVCQDRARKIQLVQELFEKEIEAVVVCPYLDIEYEYRAIFLAGEMIYLYKKQKPFVIGDGKSTIQELVEKQVSYLEEPIEGLDFARIPQKGKKVMVGWKHNLSKGAIPVLIDCHDAYYEKVRNIAIQAGNALELKFASVDVVVTKEKKVCVIEVNSRVCIHKFCELAPNGMAIGKEIYAKVIDKMLEEV